MDKKRDFAGGISFDPIIAEGSCRWKLSSRNLYTFIRPNQEYIAAKVYKLNVYMYINFHSIHLQAGPFNQSLTFFEPSFIGRGLI
jgi:hypothetical protein